jgi:sigma-B regulation protein RsbU (phosphoserine phosphatase)
MVFRRKQRGKGAGDGAAADLATLREENQRLQSAVAQLTLLNELAQAVSMSRSSDKMINAIVKRAKRALDVEQVMIYLVERQGDEDVMKTHVRHQTASLRRCFHFDVHLRAMMEIHRAPFLTNDAQSEPRLRGVELDPDLHSLLCVPLMVRGKLTGVVTACNKRGQGGFGEEDQRLLAIMANQSAQVLENTRLREEEEAYQHLRDEIQLARDIQCGLLPLASPAVPGYDIAGCSVPAELVGGDYFDFIPLPRGQLGLCLGDVSGKGIPASLLMANLQATLRGQAQVTDSVRDCMIWSNRLLYRSTTPEKFATLFYGVLDPASHAFAYSNAGHERPLLFRRSEVVAPPRELSEGGVMLGVLDDFPYVEGSLDLEPGDLLLVYSDGLTDAVNADEEPYGVERVVDTVRRLGDAPAATVVDALVGAVKTYAGPVPAFDDVTLVAMRRGPDRVPQAVG